jgi:tripartite-type tricarboxylate transporter receptor subunit TctC
MIMHTAHSRLRRILLIALSLGSVPFGMAAQAQSSNDWPTKSIRFVVPYPPGGPLDTMARVLAEQVKSSLGQPVIVENRPGAGGNIGADLIAKAQPDGYALVMGAVATHAINPALYSKIPYDAVRDFAPVALVASVPNVLIVNKGFAEKNNIRTVQDLVKYALAHPGKLNYGSGGSGSAGHLAGELLAVRTQIKAVHIPYQGAAPAKLALLSGQSEFMFDNLASAASLIKDGSVVALAVTTDKRSDILPEVPTVQEAGVKPFDIGTWFGVFATAGTPPAVIAKLHQAYSTALADPAVQTRLKQMGSNALALTPVQFAEMVVQERQKYQELVKLSGAKVD